MTPEPQVGLRGRRVAIIEDQPDIAVIVRTALEADGAVVDWYADGRQGFEAVVAEMPDLIVLDIMLPSMNGLDILRRLRPGTDVPVLVLSAVADVSDRVTGLELGADDYLTKPFSPQELVARARTLLRRQKGSTGESGGAPIAHGDLVVDPAVRQVVRAGTVVPLTAREFELLLHLARHPDRVHTREDLLRQVWSSSSEWQDPATVTEHIRRLRQKIGHDRPPRIVTVRGAGYRLETPA